MSGLSAILGDIWVEFTCKQNFPSGSDGEESACSTGDRSSILGWEDPLEKQMATHSSILAWEIPWTRNLAVHGAEKGQPRLSD